MNDLSTVIVQYIARFRVQCTVQRCVVKSLAFFKAAHCDVIKCNKSFSSSEKRPPGCWFSPPGYITAALCSSFLFVFKASLLARGEKGDYFLAEGCKKRAKQAGSLVIYRFYILFGLLIRLVFPPLASRIINKDLKRNAARTH